MFKARLILVTRNGGAIDLIFLFQPKSASIFLEGKRPINLERLIIHSSRRKRLVNSGLSWTFSQDLLTVCRELNLENSVEELMRELGADEHGRISYQEFLRRRLALRPEIEALRAGKRRGSPHHTHTPEYLPTSSDNSLGKSAITNFFD